MAPEKRRYVSGDITGTTCIPGHRHYTGPTTVRRSFISCSQTAHKRCTVSSWSMWVHVENGWREPMIIWTTWHFCTERASDMTGAGAASSECTDYESLLILRWRHKGRCFVARRQDSDTLSLPTHHVQIYAYNGRILEKKIKKSWVMSPAEAHPAYAGHFCLVRGEPHHTAGSIMLDRGIPSPR